MKGLHEKAHSRRMKLGWSWIRTNLVGIRLSRPIISNISLVIRYILSSSFQPHADRAIVHIQPHTPPNRQPAHSFALLQPPLRGAAALPSYS